MSTLHLFVSSFFKRINRRRAGLDRISHRPGFTRGMFMEPLEGRAMLTAVSWDGGGDGKSWTDPVNWSADKLPGVNDDITIANGNVGIVGGLTVNGTITLGDAGSATGGSLFFLGNQTLSGTGKIVFAGKHANNSIQSQGNGIDTSSALTIDSGITVYAGAGSSGAIYSYYLGDTVTNKGTVQADGGTITGTGLSNGSTGTLSATGDGTLNLAGTWSSAGMISVKASTVNMGGSFTLSSSGAISQSAGSSVNITGKLDNTGNTLALSAGTGNINIVSGHITGGTVTSTGGGAVTVTSAFASFHGVTFGDNALDASNVLGSVFVTDGLTINGAAKIGAAIYFIGTQTLGGTGTLTAKSTNGHALVGGSTDDVTPATLTISSGITIAVPTGVSSYIHLGGAVCSIINKGTLQADGGELHMDNVINAGTISGINSGKVYESGTWSNTGTISAVNSYMELAGTWTHAGLVSAVSSTVYLSGTTTMSASGTFAQTSSLISIYNGNFNAMFINTGNTLVLNDTTGPIRLEGGTIKGGTISGTGAGKLVLAGGTLDGVTVLGTGLDGSTGGAGVHNGLTLNGPLTLGSNSSLYFSGTQTLSGTGTITINSDHNGSGITAFGDKGLNPATLTIDSGITLLSPTGNIGGLVALYAGDKIVNHGTLSANGGFLGTAGGGTFVNNGILEAINGGTFNIITTPVPTTSISVSPTLVPVGSTVGFKATVAPATGTPTGKVSFFSGATNLGSGTISGGIATFDTSALASGTYSVTAVYGGDATFISNRSHAVSLTVYAPLAVTATQSLASPVSAAVGSWDITFNENIDVNSFDWNSVTLTRDGGANLINAGTGVTIAQYSGKKYRISGLSSVTALAGSYTLKLVDGGVKDTHGFAISAGAQQSWNMLPSVKNLSAYPAPRTAPVTAPSVRLSESADLSTFTWQDITLTRNGGANLATSGIVITQSPTDPALYTISIPSALVSTVGNYALTVNGAGIQNSGGALAYANNSSTSWTIIAGTPGAPALDATSEGKAGSGFTQYATPSVKGTASAGSTVEVYEGAALKGTGVAGVDGKYLIALSTLSVGVHALKARATDGLGTVTGYSADATITVETATPTISSMSVYSAPRTVPVGSTGIRFSSQIDLSTFTAADLTLTRDGVPVSTAGMTVSVSPTDSKLYTIVVPPASNTHDGVYVLTVTGAGIKNLAGKTVGNSFSTTWTTLPQIMNISQYPTARTAPVTVPGIRFSNPITLATFTWADITLKRNGGANLATSAITITQSATDPAVYTILIPSALTSAAGTYVLTVAGSGIQSPGGYTVSNTLSTTWTQL